MKLSIIIPTYNEQKYIEDCLKTLTVQTYSNYEIIVVDDGSTDKTLDKIKNFKVKLLQQKHKGPALARNLGAKESIGEILVFLDADMIFAPDFLEKLVRPILDGIAIGTFSKEEYVSNWDNVWARCWNFNNGIFTNRRHPDNFPDESEVFRAILRKEFLKVNGYDDLGYTDDNSLSIKLKKKAIVAKGAIYYHANPASIKEIFRDAKWFGKRESFKPSFIDCLKLNPFWSIKSVIKRVIKYRNFHFILFKIVLDFGILCGAIQKRISKRYAK